MQCIAKSKIFYAKILCNSKNTIWCKKHCLFKKLCFLKCKELLCFLKRNTIALQKTMFFAFYAIKIFDIVFYKIKNIKNIVFLIEYFNFLSFYFQQIKNKKTLNSLCFLFFFIV